MDYNTIDQVNYSEQSFSDISPVKASVINELRSNVNNCLEYLDMHRGSQRFDSHGLVTSTTAGFAPTTIFALLSSLDDQLKELEELVTHDPFPPGSIAIWNGEYEDIPKDWIACQGVQGSPDMRGRFPVGVDKTKQYKTIGGSTDISIDLAVALKYHNHSYQNAFHAMGVPGPYEWFTKFGKLYFPSRGTYDWDNYPLYLPETTDTAGKSADNGIKKAKFLPASIAKWYIMRLPNNAQLNDKKYTVTVVQPENGEIKTNYSGEVYAGTNLIITVVPKNDDYNIANIYINGNPISNNSVRPVNEDIVVTADIKHVYTETLFDSAGAYDFTVPSGVTRMRVALAGGGGGMGMTLVTHESKAGGATGTSGGVSSFGNLLEATGGNGGSGYVSRHGWTSNSAHGNGECGCWVKVAEGGSPNGSPGTAANSGYSNTSCSGGIGFKAEFNGVTITNGYGNGGYGSYYHQGDQFVNCSGGGSGGYKSGYIDVVPGETYKVVVGAAGTNTVNRVYCNPSYSATEPKQGFVLLAYGGNI